jgi:hypothetical protein
MESLFEGRKPHSKYGDLQPFERRKFSDQAKIHYKALLGAPSAKDKSQEDECRKRLTHIFSEVAEASGSQAHFWDTHRGKGGTCPDYIRGPPPRNNVETKVTYSEIFTEDHARIAQHLDCMRINS